MVFPIAYLSLVVALVVEPYRLTVLALEGRRVARVLIERPKPPEAAER